MAERHQPHRAPRRRVLPASRLLTALYLLATSLAVAVVVLAMRLPPPPSAATKTPTARCVPEDPCLAIVIDDVGRSQRDLRRWLELPVELTFAVLPHAARTREAVAALRRAGREYLLHLPLVPTDRGQITDERVVLPRRGALRGPLRSCVAAVPGLVGINNHMGSAFSADVQAARRLFRLLSPLELPFLDSRTTPSSVLCQQAKRQGVRCVRRDVFLDDPLDAATVKYRMTTAVQLARRRGWAVAIGHAQALETNRVVQRLVEAWPEVWPKVTLVRLSRVFAAAGNTP